MRNLSNALSMEFSRKGFLIFQLICVVAAGLVDPQYVLNSTILDALDEIQFRRVNFLGKNIFLWKESNDIRDPVTFVLNGNIVEKKIASIFESILSKECATKFAVPLVLDIGANYGLYGIYSAIMGCTTYMFEVQPMCQQYIYAATAMNRVSSHTHVIPHIVGNDVFKTIEVDASSHCFGVYRASRGNQLAAWKRGQRGGKKSTMSSTIIKIDDIFSSAISSGSMPRVALVKIDTEGYEYNVLNGMSKLLSSSMVRAVIIELSPVYWPYFKLKRSDVSASVVSILWDQGFTKVTMITNEDSLDIRIPDRASLLNELNDGILDGHQVFLFESD